MARSRAPSISENVPVRWRTPFWAVPALLLSAYLGVVIANPGLGHGAAGEAVRGVASWYGSQFQGLPTASGEPFDMHAMTAAHRTLPLGSHARVTNLGNGESVEVQITDRGPYARQRIIDLSYGAAQEIGMVADGSALVEVTPIAP